MWTAVLAAGFVYMVSATLVARRELRAVPSHGYPYWRPLWAIMRGLALGLIPAVAVGLLLLAIV